ncbi:hypothetical protein [Dactylosporangium sp. NPDC005555]|uniref:hypothetical protein n=1 Tax=Dactylosporangium sp. NPDC005555 TaxID=3154889 RepID=UPI0033AA2D7C
MPDPLFDSMIADAGSVRWAPADELRDRARRRTRRTRIATAAAAFTAVAVVVGGVAVAGADRAAPPPVPGGSSSPPAASSTPPPDSPSPTEAPSQGPTGAPSQGSTGAAPASVTAARFLQPSDLGSGWASTRVDNGDGDWIIEATFSAVQCAGNGWASGLTDNRQTRDLRKGSDSYRQWVGLFPRNTAAAYLDGIRAHVRDCDPARLDTKVDLAAERFAGDDALLVDFNIEGLSSRYLIVRHGEMVALIWTKGPLPDAAAKDLGRKAAARLTG